MNFNRLRWLALGILGLLAAAFAPDTARANNASPHPFTVKQPDGTEITLQIRGDEFYHWLEDTQGYSVVQSGPTYVYAVLDAQENLIPTTALVGKSDPAKLGFKPKMLPSGKAVNRLRSESPLSKPPDARPGLNSIPATGTVKNIVIMMIFSDHTTRTLPTGPQLNTLFNSVAPDPLYAPTGSVRGYYKEVSYNTFTLDTTVITSVTLPKTEAYYADGTAGGTSKIWEAITSALALADPMIDFSQFDANGDTFVDSITFLHSGYGAEWGGVDAYGASYLNRIWSHRWNIPTFTSGEGINISDYHISPAVWGTSGSAIGHIGVICHETGHFFGLPDLYDRNGGGEGIGSWCLMANSWGFTNDQLYPPHPSAWAKTFLGWLTWVDNSYQTLYSYGTYQIPRIETNRKVYRIVKGFPAGEYLLIENRQPFGFDSQIPTGGPGIPAGGLAIWHIDENKTDNDDEGFPGQMGWPGNNNHYQIALLQADGDFDLEKGNNRGDGGDLYREGLADRIDSSTVPNTNAYQDGVELLTGNMIHNISASGSNMTFDWGIKPEYYGNVGRLMQNRCMQCHHTGGPAPFSMETYAEAMPRAADIAYEVSRRTMPPWNASQNQNYDSPDFEPGKGPGEGFWHDRSLTNDEIQLLVDWDYFGAPEGDIAFMRMNPTFNDAWENGNPDVILTAPQWTLNPGDSDIYRCFVLPTGFVEDKTMVGLEVKPSNGLIAHHALLFLDPFNNGPAQDAEDGNPGDGWTCFGGAGVDAVAGLGGWAPGGNLQPFNENLGNTLPAGSNIILQMHYSANNVGVDPESDQTQIGLKLSNDPNVQQLIQFPPTRLDFTIPANTLDVEIKNTYPLPFDVHMVGVFPHMHLYGTDMRVTATKPGGQVVPLINVDKWDFNWQNHYIYNEPIALPAGTIINISGIYDNPTPNDVEGGELTNNEMLLFGLAFTTDAAIPGLGQGGIPPSHDHAPPTLLNWSVTKPNGNTVFTANFSEPVSPIHVAGDIDFLNNVDQFVAPTTTSTNGSQFQATFNALPTGQYTAIIRGFHGVQDVFGNLLDGNENGVGGELLMIAGSRLTTLRRCRLSVSRAVRRLIKARMSSSASKS